MESSDKPLRHFYLAGSQFIDEIREAFRKLDPEQIEAFIDAIINSRRVYVAGAGRSGLIARTFAQRLVHLGIKVFVIGETVVPAARPGDTVLCLSGSGETTYVVSTAQIAKKIGCKLIAITSNPDSTLAKLADVVVVVPGRTKEDLASRDFIARQLTGIHEPLSPLGSLFEVNAMIFLECTVVELMKKLNKSEEDLRREHQNIETLG